jgi:Fur family peroxide stress response transcriptional regulator
MEHSHMPKNPCKTLDAAELRLALERNGWRLTRQRAAVYAHLCSVESHPTAEHVFAAVRELIPNISLATVYKALEALVDAQVAARITDDAGVARYDGRSEVHYHLRCETTGEILDLPLPYDPNLLDKLDPQLVETLRQQGFKITGHRLELVGYFQRN